MQSTQYYVNLRNSITDDEAKTVFRNIHSHQGRENAVTKRDLCHQIWKKYNQTTDRKLRAIVADLVTQYHIPILADSGSAGYYMAMNINDINATISDLVSRRNKLTERINSLRMANLPVESHLHFPEQLQPELF